MNNKLTGVSAVVAGAMVDNAGVVTDAYFTIDSDSRHIIKGAYPTEQSALEGIARLCSKYGDSPRDYFVKKVTTTVETLG